MVIQNIFAAMSTRLAQILCGLKGHLIMVRYEPQRLSLHCGLCGYASEGWEVGRPMTARRATNNPQARPERRRSLRAVSSSARLAS